VIGSSALNARVRVEFVTHWHVYGSTRAVAVHEPTGDVFVSLNERSRIAKYDADGEKLLEFEREGEVPVGLAVDGDGNCLVAVEVDRKHRVVKYDATGAVADEWEGAGVPTGIAADDSGSIVVVASNGANHRVIRYGPDGDVVRAWNGDGASMAVALDGEGNVLVAASSDDALLVLTYSADGALLDQWPVEGDDLETYGIAVGPSGEVFVSNYQDDWVSVYSASGSHITDFGDKGPDDDEFCYPQGIAVTTTGLVYVADSRNNRIQIVQWGSP